jgi:diguanylate cyclase (GGDEF)-like protein/PAS domain S-box-containing protein
MWPYLAVYQNTSDALVLIDGERFIDVNPGALRMFGCATAPLMLGYQLADFSPLQQTRDVLSAPTLALLALRAREQGNVQFEWRCVGRDGREFWVDVLLTSVVRDGQQLLHAVMRETTARQHQQLAIYLALMAGAAARGRHGASPRTRRLAEHDALTGLPNRVLLRDRVSLALAAARRNGRLVAVLFIDLDRFKGINDALGHHVGDLLLREAAARLVRCVRSVDTVSRHGGDEFVVVLADIGAIDQAAHVAATIRQAIGREFRIGAHRLHVSASIGVAIFPGDGDGLDTLLQHADLAMYHAKSNGRNGFQFFSPEMNRQVRRRTALEHELRQALALAQFRLVYEAQVDIATGQPAAAEALLRWRHPVRGLLRPEHFMGVAEDAGLMVPIGDWVLAQACAEAARWRDIGHPLVVAVNLSRSQFMQKNLVDKVRAALDAASLPPHLLELELTEAVIMHHDGAALATLAALSALGVRLALDDFGTGYTRVGQLRDYPLNKLKIDASFVSGAHGADGAHGSDGANGVDAVDDVDDGDGAGDGRGGAVAQVAVVTAIIAIAHSLGLEVLAEGVESDTQYEFLRRHGCDQYQGVYARASGQLDGLSGLLD